LNSGHFDFYLYLCFLLENCVCLFRGVQVPGVAWQPATRIVAGVGDLEQRTEDDCTCWVLGGRTIEKSSDAVCGLHRAREDEEHEFLDCASKQGRRFVSDLASKPLGRFISGLASKPM
jgi:hypothetical protein